jgi:hypothetical protein
MVLCMLAAARLAFLAHGDHAELDAAIDACLARTERTPLYPLAGHQLPGPVRYETSRPRTSRRCGRRWRGRR